MFSTVFYFEFNFYETSFKIPLKECMHWNTNNCDPAINHITSTSCQQPSAATCFSISQLFMMLMKIIISSRAYNLWAAFGPHKMIEWWQLVCLMMIGYNCQIHACLWFNTTKVIIQHTNISRIPVPLFYLQ